MTEAKKTIVEKPEKSVDETSSKESKTKKLKKVTKKSLRTMQKTRSKHPVRTQARIVKYGTSGFRRNIWLSSAATVVMAITLIILFVTVVASVILTSTAELMKDKIDITVYVKPNTSQEVLDELTSIISNDKNVKSVETSTSEEEYDKFLEENAESDDVINILDEDMRKLMIAKMQGTMRIKVYNVDDLTSIKDLVETDEVFKQYTDKEKAPTYDVNQAEIATITSWARIARTGGLILAVVFLVISVLIIFSTIRMAIFSRREEIYMMKLVGAEKRFIRGPFLVEAEICGVIAGVVAATISYFGFMFMAPKLSSYGIDVTAITDVLQSNKLILVYLVFIAAGMIIGRVSARLAVSKYLHKT
ncbi:MAG: permease-like cell division protein FtsX [Candidatus Saccharibacteria bacterium]|nr:permease-like cell division protein FtsX [Candidatus Saccharibacteria bacterium]MDO4398875.1 permease-like cell division protein FtsX [Candidatus Saccharibacteria bacterium]